MQGIEHGRIGVAFGIVAAFGLVLLILPIAMMIPLSLESGHLLRFPPESISLHWYSAYLASDAWIASTTLSLKVAAAAATIATVAGTLAAVALTRMPSRARSACFLALMSPIFLPTVVVAIAIYGVFASLQLAGSAAGLVLAHAVLTLPVVVLNVGAALAAAPRSLEEAAWSLGARPMATFFQVTVPTVRGGIATGFVFAFLISFDEVVIANLLSGLDIVTLPKRMFDGMFYEITPILAAISVMLVAMNVVLVIAWRAFARR
jgi:ABC-type spermidine/putrescine transport system permease subunit II